MKYFKKKTEKTLVLKYAEFRSYVSTIPWSYKKKIVNRPALYTRHYGTIIHTFDIHLIIDVVEGRDWQDIDTVLATRELARHEQRRGRATRREQDEGHSVDNVRLLLRLVHWWQPQVRVLGQLRHVRAQPVRGQWRRQGKFEFNHLCINYLS